jgi:hypothetical protein
MSLVFAQGGFPGSTFGCQMGSLEGYDCYYLMLVFKVVMWTWLIWDLLIAIDLFFFFIWTGSCLDGWLSFLFVTLQLSSLLRRRGVCVIRFFRGFADRQLADRARAAPVYLVASQAPSWWNNYRFSLSSTSFACSRALRLLLPS